MRLDVTYVGGPTALLDFGGARLLTDPTFDPAGTDYPTPVYTLHKTQGPGCDAASLGQINAVLLSHDHHFDNLDRRGRATLAEVPIVFTTHLGAERLGPPAVGLAPWQAATIASPTGPLTITAVPARHGPPEGDRGPVIGFVLHASDSAEPVVYVSGDTVWFDGVREVGQRYEIAVALLNLGAAKVAVAGPSPLTFTAAEAVALAQAWPRARIVPLHFEGWAHFSEGRQDIEAAFAAAGLHSRLQWLDPGRSTQVL